jgi:excisionase family DNA binding protein
MSDNKGTQALLTPAQVAERLQVSIRTVRRLHDRDRLPGAVRIGRQLRWREASIETWIRRNER